MIAGYFTEQGLPYVQARLVLPRIGVDSDVVFLVDTGAASTVLHSNDANDLDCPNDRLILPQSFEGVGGVLTYYRETALIKFSHGDGTHDLAVQIAIAKPGSPTDGLPSLLGRDILNRMRMDYDFPQDRLELVYS